MAIDLGAKSQVMNTHELKAVLSQFTGTEHYYRLMPRLVVTDGVQYLANQASCYWLISAIYSHLVTERIQSEFVVARLTVSESTGSLVLDDGNDHVICQQQIDYTDFPLDEIKLYCCYQDAAWVVLLPSEY